MQESLDWQLPPEAFDWLGRHLLHPPSARVLELGSGHGSARLAKMCAEVFSVEHDPAWLGVVPGVNYIHAPIVDGWYSTAAITEAWPHMVHCVIVDGPPAAIGRGGILNHLNLFDGLPVLIDDVNRPECQAIAQAFASRRQQMLSIHITPKGRAFSTIGFDT